MIPPTPPLDLKLAACGKLGYVTPQMVLEVLFFRQVAEWRQGRRSERARYYHCPSCGYFHIGYSHRRWRRPR
jgi:hypothetical protein